jgi:hypothetical protein
MEVDESIDDNKQNKDDNKLLWWYNGESEVEKVVQPVNLVDRKYLSNHSLTENIKGKSRYVLSILAYQRNLSAKA